jgi:hypothetical protein
MRSPRDSDDLIISAEAIEMGLTSFCPDSWSATNRVGSARRIVDRKERALTLRFLNLAANCSDPALEQFLDRSDEGQNLEVV